MCDVCSVSFLLKMGILEKTQAKRLGRRKIIKIYQIWLDQYVSVLPPEQISNPNYLITPGGTSVLNLPPDCLFGCFFYLKEFDHLTPCNFVCKYFNLVLMDGRCWESVYRRYNPKVSEELVMRFQGDYKTLFLDMVYKLGRPVRTRGLSEKLVGFVRDYYHGQESKTTAILKSISKLLAKGVDPSFPGKHESPMQLAVGYASASPSPRTKKKNMRRNGCPWYHFWSITEEILFLFFHELKT